MKQRDIDRWANRQARMNKHAAVPAINWIAIAVIGAVAVVLIVIFLRAAHIL